MLSREGFLNDAFLRWFPYEPTPCQYALLQKVAKYVDDILGGVYNYPDDPNAPTLEMAENLK